MAINKYIGQSLDIQKRFASEDGKHYRGYRQDLDPVIKRVEEMRQGRIDSKIKNPNEWRHIGSIPMTMLVDWLAKNRYTMDQWARNEDRAKDKFLRHFMSRDYSKLHNNHITTKKESSQIVVPNFIGSK